MASRETALGPGIPSNSSCCGVGANGNFPPKSVTFLLKFFGWRRAMVFGMSLHTYTLIHVAISLVGIVSGLFVLFGMLGGKRLDGLTSLVLFTTGLTSVTG